MNISEAMREIESHGFAARLGFSSDLNTFLRSAKKEDSVISLNSDLESTANRQKVLSRILDLTKQHTDLRYENPSDTALAVYLWLLDAKDLELSKLAAQVIFEAQHCWWSRGLSSNIILKSQLQSASTTKWSLTKTLPGPVLAFPRSLSGESLTVKPMLRSFEVYTAAQVNFKHLQTQDQITGILKWTNDDRPQFDFSSKPTSQLAA